ncbi:MAG: dipeptidase [Litorilinea sp.]
MSPTANAIPVFDGHNDTLLSLYAPRTGAQRAFFTQSEYGHIDFPRAQAGNLAGGLFAIFTRSEAAPTADADKFPGTTVDATGGYSLPMGAPVEQSHALAETLAMAALLLRLERENAEQVKVVRTGAELDAALAEGRFAMVFHIEGAEAIDADLNALEVLYAAGLRSLGLTWSRNNIFAHGVPFSFPQSPDIGPGLTAAGKALVRACNDLGILIDLSHLNEKGFWDVAELSSAPLAASHSNVHALSNSARNLTDRQLDAVKASNGIVGLNFHCAFLREDGRADPDTELATLVRHMDYMVERMGIDHVGLGSDFDGAVMPAPIHDVTGLPNLLDALRQAGYSEDELHQIAYRNWLRVLKTTWGT